MRTFFGCAVAGRPSPPPAQHDRSRSISRPPRVTHVHPLVFRQRPEKVKQPFQKAVSCRPFNLIPNPNPLHQRWCHRCFHAGHRRRRGASAGTLEQEVELLPTPLTGGYTIQSTGFGHHVLHRQLPMSPGLAGIYYWDLRSHRRSKVSLIFRPQRYELLPRGLTVRLNPPMATQIPPGMATSNSPT